MNKTKTTQVCSLIVMLMLAGCNNKGDINTTTSVNDKNVSVIKPNAPTADMSAGIITIDGKQVNLGEIPLPTTQPSKFKITPQMLYAIAYQVSGVTNDALIELKVHSKQAAENSISDIEKQTGVKVKYKIVDEIVDESLGKTFYSIAILTTSHKDFMKVANYYIEHNLDFAGGLAQLNAINFMKEPSLESYSNPNYKHSLVVGADEYFSSNFQYKILSKRILECEKEMKSLDGVMGCLYNNHNEFYQDTSDYASVFITISQNSSELSSADMHREANKEIFSVMIDKEASGAYKGKFANFQTTYKKLFGEEYKNFKHAQITISPKANKTNAVSTDIKSQSHKLMTGMDMVSQNDIIVQTNSKGAKIYCLSDMSMCKTELEVVSYSSSMKD